MSAWLFYALLAPLLFAIGNIFDKFLRDKHLNTFSLSIFVSLASLWVLALVPFVELPGSAKVIAAGLAAGVIFFLNAFPYFHALSLEEASRVIPLWALEAPAVLVLAFVFLGERLAISDYVGFVFVVAGAFLVLTRKISDMLKPRRAFFLMLLASSLTAVGMVASKWLYSETSFWAVQVLLGIGNGSAALIALLVVVLAKKGRLIKGMLKLGKAVGVQLAFRQLAIIAAFIIFGLALMTGSASLSAALAQLSALFVFVIAAFLSRFLPRILEEEIDRKTLLMKAVAISLIIAGVFAINL